MIKKIREFIIEKLIFLSGIVTIVIVVLIFVFLIKESGGFFVKNNLFKFLFGRFWYPVSDPPKFGILPMVFGSLLVTAIAIVIAVPLGIANAIFISEIAKGKTKEVLKSAIEMLQAIPSVVIGFIGIIVLNPLVRHILGVPVGLCAFTVSILLALMALPTIVSVMEDAITAVPKRYREGALALGATRWQAIYKVVIPAASSGIVAAIMLGIGRAIGETMVVLMVAGNAAAIPKTVFAPVSTLTSTIAAEMGETVRGSDHYYSLFAIGIVLFAVTFVVNFVADFYIHRRKVR